MLGGRRARGLQLGGSGIGAVPGGNVAAYVDRLERDLRSRISAGVEVVRRGNNLDLRLASGTAFDFNAATVSAQFRGSFAAIAQTLAGYPSTFVDIGGYTDAVGTDAVNQKLSDDRAAATADTLARLGVARVRIAARGYGKTMPIASNADAAGRAQNRRVEIHLSPIVDDDLRGGR